MPDESRRHAEGERKPRIVEKRHELHRSLEQPYGRRRQEDADDDGVDLDEERERGLDHEEGAGVADDPPSQPGAGASQCREGESEEAEQQSQADDRADRVADRAAERRSCGASPQEHEPDARARLHGALHQRDAEIGRRPSLGDEGAAEEEHETLAEHRDRDPPDRPGEVVVPVPRRDGTGCGDESDAERPRGEQLEPERVGEDARDSLEVAAALGDEARGRHGDSQIGGEDEQGPECKGERERPIARRIERADEEERQDRGERCARELGGQGEERVSGDAVGLPLRRRRASLLPGFVIDLHSHILPGIDDGARSLEEARELARLAVREGVTAIAATPHVRADYPTTPERMERGVSELQRDFGRQGIRLEVVRGGEIDIQRLSVLSEADLERFTLAGGGRYLLLEFPYFGWPLALDAAVTTLVGLGLTPVLAHPERSATVQERPSRLGGLVAAGALVQVTAGSLAGAFGRSSRNAARALVASGLVHVLASDAHSPDARDAGLAAGVEALDDAGLAAYLTEETPAAIVAGGEVGRTPPRRRFRLLPRWEAGFARATTIIRRGSE